MNKTQTESWFTHSEPQTVEHCPLLISKLKSLRGKERLNTHIQSVSPILKVMDWFCVQCRDFFTSNLKCCPNCHEGFSVFLQRNVIKKHDVKAKNHL
ncbi:MULTISPECIES: putative zinc ribbon protein [Providencia]|uniref:putative zinc ribbon protein n=1 Tax=Providencia TaxID=586 RepID=UPI0010124AEB|nr:hypothetical protein D0Z62_11235 [Providencia rettgeri]